MLSSFLLTAAVVALPLVAVASPSATEQQRVFAPAGRRLERVARPARVSSVVVHVVDPASPTTSTVVTPALIARQALEYYGEEDEDQDLPEASSPNFGQPCEYRQSPFTVCGDYYDSETETDHGLFCSPSGFCASKGSVCGSNSACSTGLVCNLSTHRCETESAQSLSISESRRNSRQRTAMSNCPDRAQACYSPAFGGFECVFTGSEVTQCGGCIGTGGIDCSKIEGALATSCRHGSCVIHACAGGYAPSEDGTECIDELL
ncbi:uncharacterized protein JCM15063_005561 [Sporobolomyces koalae]|uniref:uncharacterized protein n=1 Tax=Sporobolomyces koalae TaxID=500713 RepID=UPI003180FC88